MKNSKGFVLIDSIMALMILVSVVSVLYLMVMGLLNNYAKSISNYMELIKEWQDAVIH